MLLSYIYLALPLGLFFLTWLKAPYALLLTSALFISGIFIYKDQKRSKKLHLGIIVLAAIWVYFSGSGGFSFQNGDWIKHNAILSDLIFKDWPVRYQSPDGTETFLNYYLGWYMVPAIIGKISQNLQIAFIAQYIWTLMGVLISFSWLSRIVKKPHWWIYMFFILFATADSLGILLLRNTNLLNFITPLEHWSTHEYSSFTTLLYWVPGQAHGIWIVMSICIYLLNNKGLHNFPIWIALLLFWSPFGVIGLMPFISYMIYRTYKQGGIRDKQFLYHTISAALIFIFFHVFFGANIFTATYGKDFSGIWKADSIITWGRFGVFLFAETIVPMSLIFVLRKFLNSYLKNLFYIAIPILLFLPFFKYGLLNDLVMRASIPSLFIVFLCSYTLLTSKKVRTQHTFLWFLLMAYFVLGAVTPLTEINRSLQSEPNVGTSHTLSNIGDEMAIKQYLGSEKSIVGRYILK